MGGPIRPPPPPPQQRVASGLGPAGRGLNGLLAIIIIFVSVRYVSSRSSLYALSGEQCVPVWQSVCTCLVGSLYLFGGQSVPVR